MAVKIETGEEMLGALREHILQLNSLSKNLQSNKNFDDLENEWSAEPIRTKHVFQPSYWRGADVQVIEAFEGDTLEDWKKHEDLRFRYYSQDDPIPCRYPKLLSALMAKISEGTHYLDHINKFEFYFQFSKTGIALELSGETISKVRLCSTVIFNQIRLLSEWIQGLEIELKSPRKPSLIELGWKYYFAFGRNVNREAMLGENRCPKAIYLGQASLSGYRLAIDQKGYATVLLEEASEVIGVLWAINPEDESRLDLREGVRINSYRKETLSVECNEAEMFGGPNSVEALVYVSNRTEKERPEAQEGYLELIEEGLREALYSEDIIRRNLSFEREALKNQSIENVHNYERKLKIIGGASLPEELDLSLPFFAYGVFKIGEFGSASLDEHRKKYFDEAFVPESCLLERDGLPLLCLKDKPSENLTDKISNASVNKVYGDVLYFSEGDENRAYQKIADIEPSKQYIWAELNVLERGHEIRRVNCFLAKSPNKGTFVLDTEYWSLKHDAFFQGVIEFADECLEQNLSPIRCQAAYLMVWTALERIAALKFSLSLNPTQNILNFSSEPSFTKSINQFLDDNNGFNNLRDIYSNKDIKVQRPSETDYGKTVKYLYHIRSNITHRGKGGYIDGALINDCLEITSAALKNLMLTIDDPYDYNF